jgi:Zn-dependent M28 family amino/carboxypeptidase
MEDRLRSTGHPVKRETFSVEGKAFHNLVLELRGSSSPAEIVVIGAHYDSVLGCPGANDNGTGSAALLALARAFARTAPARTLRFAAFPNEEPPHFQTMGMGSRAYARLCKERGEQVAAMVSLETIGFYSEAEGSQQYPAPLSLIYPSRGNFIAFVGNVGSGGLVRRAIGTFRKRARFPSEGAALPGWLPGVGWSDHWSFWEEGYPAIMVTDTAVFRYPHYHLVSDTPDKVDYESCARVVSGLRAVIEDLAGVPPPPPGP